MTPEQQAAKQKRGSAEPQAGRCGRRMSKTNPPRYCLGPAFPKCKFHRGAPAGPSNARWIHGRYSKFLPPQLMSRVEELMADPDILTLVPNIQLVDANIAELYGQLQDPQHQPAWDGVVKAVEEMERAYAVNDAKAGVDAFSRLRDLMKHGRTQLEVLRQLTRLQDQRRKLVQTEAARLTNEAQAISYDRAVGVVVRLVDVMFRHVLEPKVRDAIIRDVRALELGPGRFAGQHMQQEAKPA